MKREARQNYYRQMHTAAREIYEAGQADERERIIKLLEQHLWFEKGKQDTILGMLDGSYKCDCKGCIELIKGETK